ncbi:MAG: putative lipoprotein YmcC precursor [Rhodocyclaceae bacterium]|nr:putative lipoprotein YmcC precursor [Rhodocyclaceae bacterium]
MDRRNFLSLLVASATLGGCANSIVGRTLVKAAETSFGSSSAFNPDYPDKLPYASLAVMTKSTPQALLILAKAEGGELHWMSSDRGVLVTRNGRLVRTVGLPENLLYTDFLKNDFFEAGHLPHAEASSVKRLVDMAPGNRYGILVESTLTRVRQEKIRIGRHEYDVMQFVEYCVAPQLSWEYANTYWVDAQGMMWRSIQHVVPGMEPVEIEVTKPFRA